MIEHYKNEQYKEACVEGISIFRSGEKEDSIISLIGDSCARSDYINILAEIQKYQTKTKESRENASYFTTLVLQKRLLFQFLFDDLDLTNLVLPKTEHILSKVFINLSNKNFTLLFNKPKKIKIVDGENEYILYYSYPDKKIYIEEKSHNELIKRHRFS